MNGLKSIPNWILWTAALLAAALVFRFAMRGYAYIGYTLAFIAANFEELAIPVHIWLFLQSLCLDIAYLSFQTIFFERFIACFKIRGNVGFFIITIDFVGYLGTLALLFFKEYFASQPNDFNFLLSSMQSIE